MKPFAIIFSFIWIAYCPTARSAHSFGIITDIEMQDRQGEGQKNKTAFQNFITLEQNWSNASTKFTGQFRIFQFYRQESRDDIFIHEAFPGELNIETKFKNQKITLGYQSLFLSEGFNLIETEIFNAKNNEISIFKSPDKKYYTSPGLNYQIFGDRVSFQLAALKAERVERLSISQKQSLTSSSGNFSEPDYRKQKQDWDQLAKILGTVGSVDWSMYASRTFEKSPTYQYNVVSTKYESVSEPFSSLGLGFSGLLGSAVLRLDYQKNINRIYIDSANSQIQSDQDNINLNCDQAIGNKLRLNFVYGTSRLSKDLILNTRERELKDIFANINFKMTDTTNIDLSGFERLGTDTKGILLAVNTKILSNIEVVYGSETYWTGASSKLHFLSQEDKMFVNLKATTF